MDSGNKGIQQVGPASWSATNQLPANPHVGCRLDDKTRAIKSLSLQTCSSESTELSSQSYPDEQENAPALGPQTLSPIPALTPEACQPCPGLP